MIPDIKIRGEFRALIHHYDAIKMAHRFIQEFPDRVGMNHGVAFTIRCGCLRPHELIFYVYRTATGTIVVHGDS